MDLFQHILDHSEVEGDDSSHQVLRSLTVPSSSTALHDGLSSTIGAALFHGPGANDAETASHLCSSQDVLVGSTTSLLLPYGREC